MALKKGNEIPTIDVAMVTIKQGETEIALDTASKIAVSPETEVTDAVKLIIKGVLKAQKRAVTTLTGNTITLTDNVFNPEVVKILQGGTITYDTQDTTKVIKYTPPVAGAVNEVDPFELVAYSAVYDEAGILQEYEKITYPNCKGEPIALTSEDNVFRVNEYTISSAPSEGQAPYTIEYVDALPVIS